MERCKVDFESIPWESAAVGLRFKVFKQGGRQLRLVEISEEFVETDWCTKGHIGYCLEGQLEIDFDGEVVRFAPGDGLFIPPGEERKHKPRVHQGVARLVFVEEA